MTLNAAVFASGGGSNLQALLDHSPPEPAWRVTLVVTDRPGAGALGRAEVAGVPTAVVSTKGRTSSEVGAELVSLLDSRAIDVIFLAGYLKLVPQDVVARYRGRILNIHPALLPAFGGQGMYGMHVHRAVLKAGVDRTGPTVHMADEEYDRGMIVAQWPVPVLAGDTPEDVAARVLAVEHQLYPEAADHVCRAIAAGEVPHPFTPAGSDISLDPAGGDQIRPTSNSTGKDQT